MAYPPIEAAKLSALSVSGVKIYAKRYAPFFSPSANPERNVPRSYTDADVARLRLIGSLAKQGIPTARFLPGWSLAKLAICPRMPLRTS